jgi:hypothetical protein
MKTAHPASFPPGVSGSGGMMRSTMASTARPSGPVKKTHGPGLTGTGGLPAFGAQGRRSAMTAASADKPPSNQNAVPANKCRRLTPMTKTGEPGSLKLPNSQNSLGLRQVVPIMGRPFVGKLSRYCGPRMHVAAFNEPDRHVRQDAEANAFFNRTSDSARPSATPILWVAPT